MGRVGIITYLWVGEDDVVGMSYSLVAKPGFDQVSEIEALNHSASVPW